MSLPDSTFVYHWGAELLPSLHHYVEMPYKCNSIVETVLGARDVQRVLLLSIEMLKLWRRRLLKA